MIRIAPPEDYGPLDAACARAGTFDWIVFSSANAVDAFMERLLLDAAGPARARTASSSALSGRQRPSRLARYGLKVDLTPAEYRAEALLQAISDGRDVAGMEVLLPHADIGRELIADELRKRGADVTEVDRLSNGARRSEREGRTRHLPHAARTANRRGHVHEPVEPCGTS